MQQINLYHRPMAAQGPGAAPRFHSCSSAGPSGYPQGAPHSKHKALLLRSRVVSPAYHAVQASGYGYPVTVPYAGDNPGSGTSGWFDFSNGCYLKGFMVGAVVTLVLTNPGVQKAMIRGAVKLWSFVQGGVEEVKEQFQDIKAEMSQEPKP